MINIKIPTFLRLIIESMEKIREYCINNYVTSFRNMFDMEHHVDQDTWLNHFIYALEAVDVTFQQSNIHSGNIQERKIYYLWKAQAARILSKNGCSTN